jgi:uncharacterized membrane protein (DUF2068 family)
LVKLWGSRRYWSQWFGSQTGVGLWTLKTWGRSLTLALTGLWLFFGLFGLLHRPFPTHILRIIIDGIVLVYLVNPDVKKFFT